ncbi:MAG: Holliday junction branch migration protein RuvA [Erysipelotrichaceae bacterium]
MIAFIKGTVFAYKMDYVILENNGIGYRIYFNHPEALVLNQEMTIYTYQHVREDEISLFGFLDLVEHDVFLKLISVKGLGPKTALNILGFTTADRIIQAVETNDIAFIKKFPGVGNKTASQIILDLKGKLVEQDNNKNETNSDIKDAMEALKALGYKAAEISFLNKVFEEQTLTSDEYIKLGLKLLMGKKRG